MTMLEKIVLAVVGIITGDTASGEPEKSEAERGAELVAKLWIDTPEDWTEHGYYPRRFQHKKLNLTVSYDYLYPAFSAQFDGSPIAIPKDIRSKMHAARTAYDQGVANAKMNQTARELAAAILNEER